VAGLQCLENGLITKIRVIRFKGFDDQVFDLGRDCVLLAGPNNSGKTTVLQAIATWNLARMRWLQDRGVKGRKRRLGLLLEELTSIPLREMNLLWLNRHTSTRRQGERDFKPAPIYIQVFHSRGKNVEESLTIEFYYANERLMYIRPVVSPDQPDAISALPDFAVDETLHVVHVPPFSGIGTQEPKHGEGFQNKLVGEGKPGEIVRNLLLRIWDGSKRDSTQDPWKEFSRTVEELFRCHLLPPDYSERQPFIVAEYIPDALRVEGRVGPRLDIANAGSGFHQVLLLLSFLFAHPSSILLLDEPDAHLHVLLQRTIFERLKQVAFNRRCQLIVATHAEVLLDRSSPEEILSFVGRTPRRLLEQTDKSRLRDALRRLTSLDLLQVDAVQAVLYVEDYLDAQLLETWARIAGHPALRFLSMPYIVPLGGKGNIKEGFQHFQCLRLARPGIHGLCVLDRDQDLESAKAGPQGLRVLRWNRYEIENYLLNPEVLIRFVRRDENLFNSQRIRQDIELIKREFEANFPANVNYLGDIASLAGLKGGDFLVELLGKTSSPLQKNQLSILAGHQRKEEIHPEVIAMLTQIEELLPKASPIEIANCAIPEEPSTEGDQQSAE
jgi:predicted ATPase